MFIGIDEQRPFLDDGFAISTTHPPLVKPPRS